jgi:RNA polymerase sigma-70 factor (ECF subfamily)
LAQEDGSKLDPTQVAALYFEHADELRRFLVGLLRDPQLAGDVLQAAFAKALEVGNTSREETRKGWLFRVAYHEAMAVRRRQTIDQRAIEKLHHRQGEQQPKAAEPLIRRESAVAVQAAVEQLPAAQRQVVRMRMYEEKTFAVIAEELGIPLGTALGRMRSALAKLRTALKHEQENDD